jgi:hypothetical protein
MASIYELWPPLCLLLPLGILLDTPWVIAVLVSAMQPSVPLSAESAWALDTQEGGLQYESTRGERRTGALVGMCRRLITKVRMRTALLQCPGTLHSKEYVPSRQGPKLSLPQFNNAVP